MSSLHVDEEVVEDVESTGVKCAVLGSAHPVDRVHMMSVSEKSIKRKVLSTK